MHNIAITTECVADLPKSLLEKADVDIIYYDVQTESGLFRDTDEIDAQNIMEYMIGGKKMAQSVVPSANEYKNFFRNKLADYDEVIHICISGGISIAKEHADLGKAKLGGDGRKVHIVDSKHLSSGLGIMVLEAAKCRDNRMDSSEIVAYLNSLIPRISTSFITNNADYLYYNGKVSKTVMDICNKFRLHPVLTMKDGVLTLDKIYIGNYHRIWSRYVKSLLKNGSTICKENGFVTYAGCGQEQLNKVKREVSNYVLFDNLYEQQASATVSCNCGPLTFGVLFLREA